MNKSPNRLKPILIGTLVITGISVFPILSFINLICCAGVMLGGLAAVFVYNKELTGTGISLEYKDGGIIGVLCGIVSAILVSGFTLLMSLFSDTNMILEVVSTANKFGILIPPEAQETLDKLSAEYVEYGYSPTLTLMTFASNIIIYPLFSAIGAIIGISILKKKNQNKQVV